MRHRIANIEDSKTLGELNRQLIKDEGHRNSMTTPELIERMHNWLITVGLEVVAREEPAQALVGIRLDGQRKANCTKDRKDHKEFRDKPCADPVWNPATSSSITFAGVAIGYNSSR